MPLIIKLKVVPTAIEFMEREVILDAEDKICLDRGAIDLLIANTEERSNPVWKTRGAFGQRIPIWESRF